MCGWVGGCARARAYSFLCSLTFLPEWIIIEAENVMRTNSMPFSLLAALSSGPIVLYGMFTADAAASQLMPPSTIT